MGFNCGLLHLICGHNFMRPKRDLLHQWNILNLGEDFGCDLWCLREYKVAVLLLLELSCTLLLRDHHPQHLYRALGEKFVALFRGHNLMRPDWDLFYQWKIGRKMPRRHVSFNKFNLSEDFCSTFWCFSDYEVAVLLNLLLCWGQQHLCRILSLGRSLHVVLCLVVPPQVPILDEDLLVRVTLKALLHGGVNMCNLIEDFQSNLSESEIVILLLLEICILFLNLYMILPLGLHLLLLGHCLHVDLGLLVPPEVALDGEGLLADVALEALLLVVDLLPVAAEVAVVRAPVGAALALEVQGDVVHGPLVVLEVLPPGPAVVAPVAVKS